MQGKRQLYFEISLTSTLSSYVVWESSYFMSREYLPNTSPSPSFDRGGKISIKSQALSLWRWIGRAKLSIQFPSFCPHYTEKELGPAEPICLGGPESKRKNFFKF